MKVDLYTRIVLTAIAALLAVLAFRPLAEPRAVRAQSDLPDVYIEPGWTTLRKPDGTAQMQGKMVVDLGTGNVWGFPTLTNGPYPVDPINTTPPVSKPMLLGKFDMGAIRRGR